MILAIDTSGSLCGVAIWKSGEIFFAESDSALRHNELLLNQIHEFLQAQNVALADLRAVAVSSGPGSFTGLRVGMAVAKGLCWSRQLPLISVPTLDAYADTVSSRFKRTVPLMPARANEVYWSLYEWEAVSGWSAKTPCRVSSIGSLPGQVSGRIVLCGEGFIRHRAKLEELFGERASVSDSIGPLVASVAHLAADRFASLQFEDLFQVEPAYHYPFLRQAASGAGLGD